MTAREDIKFGVEPKGLGGHSNRQANTIHNAQFNEVYKALGAVKDGVNSGAEGAVLPQFLPITNGGTGGGTVEEARANLGVYSKTQVDNLIANEGATAIENGGTGGTTVEEARLNLNVYSKEEVDTAISSIDTGISGTVPIENGGTGGGTVEEARLNLNVYSKEEVDTAISNISITEAIPIEQGGTGAETVAQARTNLNVYSKAEVDTAISSSVPVVVDATTTDKGVVELATQAEVNTGTDNERAVTPATLKGGIQSHLNVTGNSPMFACRAWVNFNATTGTPVISASGNVTSITDNGVGDFTVNFTTAMPDANYAVAGVTGNNDVTNSPAAASIRTKTGGITTTSCRVRTANHFINSGAAAYDMPYNSVIIFR